MDADALGERLHIQEILPKHFDGISEVIDVSPRQVGLSQHLGIPAGIPYRQRDTTESGTVALPPGAVLVSLVGPHTVSHNSPDALEPALRQLRPGTGALLLPAWPIDKLPYRRLVKPLAGAGCQVVQAVALDASSIREVQCALIVEPATAPETSPEERSAELLLTNERMVGDLVTQQMRHRTVVLRKEARAKVAERDARVREAEQKLAEARRQITELESSPALQVGRVVVNDARRRPARAVLSVPAKLARLWLSRRSRSGHPHPSTSEDGQLSAAGPAPSERVVSIALPDGAQGRKALTLTAPKTLRIPRLLAKGGIAAHEPDAMACFLAAIDVARPGAVLDIGANVGIYAAAASVVSNREVVAFEPTPALAAVSRRFAADNALGYAVESLALGAESGAATLFLSDRSDASNSLASGFRNSSEQITVPVETLDSYVARTGVAPAVMKIDTETTEPEVLKGAAGTIAEHRPWILCEVLAGKVEERLTEVIVPFGYHWYQVTDQVPYPEASEISGDKTSRMWLFAPEQPTDAFWAALRTRLAALAA